MEAGVTESAAIVDAGSSGPTDDIKTVDPYQAIKRKRLWRPLDVQRHSEAYQRLTGYILVVLLAMATGALAVVYEVRACGCRALTITQRLGTADSARSHHKCSLCPAAAGLDHSSRQGHSRPDFRSTHHK